jgi:hypothetical protein
MQYDAQLTSGEATTKLNASANVVMTLFSFLGIFNCQVLP